MTKFTWNDVVRVKAGSKKEYRPLEKAAIFSVETKRRGSYFEKFPPGVIYGIEFEDGSAIEVHEDDLELFPNITE